VTEQTLVELLKAYVFEVSEVSGYIFSLGTWSGLSLPISEHRKAGKKLKGFKSYINLPVLSLRGLTRDEETESLFLNFLENYRMEYFLYVTHNKRATIGKFYEFC
jgi:hypothetical protein